MASLSHPRKEPNKNKHVDTFSKLPFVFIFNYTFDSQKKKNNGLIYVEVVCFFLFYERNITAKGNYRLG